MRSMRRCFVFAFAALAPFAVAQIKLPGIELPGLEDLLFKKGDVFSTNLKDAWEGAKFLDGFEPETVKITAADRNAKGTWTLKSGAYTADIRSFCGRGYSYGPSKGMGYATGPWKGEHAQILQNLVRKYSLSDVAQRDAQLLIWAILSRTKPSKLAPELKATAAKLLTPDEIRKLEGYSVDALSEDMMRRVIGKADSALRPLYEAENKVRSMASQANRPFEDFEKLMVTTAPENLPSTINKGRWIWHKNGYFYRTMPSHYSRTTLEVVVPRKPEITRDAKGRITRLECPPGVVSEMEYDDSKEAVKCPGDEKLTMVFFKRVKVSMPDPKNEGQTLTYEKVADGFIFDGTPSKKSASFWGELVASIRPVLQDWAGRLEGAHEQYERYNEYRDYYDRYNRIENGEASSDDFFDLSHYRDGLWSALTGGGLGWIADHHARQAEALAHATNVLDGLPDGSDVYPSDGVMVPGNPGSQRLLGSSSTW